MQNTKNTKVIYLTSDPPPPIKKKIMKLLNTVIFPDKTEEFRFSLDVFENSEEYRTADRHFKYIGNTVRSRTWQFIGKLADFEAELAKFGLKITGGFRAEPHWQDGDWISVSVRK